jgi:hypothetical protein
MAIQIFFFIKIDIVKKIYILFSTVGQGFLWACRLGVHASSSPRRLNFLLLSRFVSGVSHLPSLFQSAYRGCASLGVGFRKTIGFSSGLAGLLSDVRVVQLLLCIKCKV